MGNDSWDDESAGKELDRLIELCVTLSVYSRSSAEWVQWRMNTLSFLEDVFGKASRQYKSFAAIAWGKKGQILMDPDDMRRDRMGRLEGLNVFLARVEQEAAVEQLGVAKGILQAARDDLERKGLAKVFIGGSTGDEASDLLRVIKLAERQWRKTIRDVPDSERQVQDAFETLLIGAQLEYTREAEAVPYSSKSYKPDFVAIALDLAIEIKLCPEKRREKELMAEINDDILAYKTRFKNILFAIYDVGVIRDVDQFSADFERTSGVIVRVIKH